MILTVTQPEIEAGIKMYLSKMGIGMKGVDISMSFSAKRVGSGGIVAEVEIVPSELKSLVDEAVQQAAEEAPEAVVEETTDDVVEPAEEVSEASDVVPETKAVSLFG